MLPITAYTDRYSVAPGETIAFKVSSAASEDYNGKLEAPRVLAAALDPAAAFLAAGEAPGSGEAVVAAWDFSREMSSTRIIDTGSHAMHGETVNLPGRAMTGPCWTGEEMCWRHAPEHPASPAPRGASRASTTRSSATSA